MFLYFLVYFLCPWDSFPSASRYIHCSVSSFSLSVHVCVSLRVYGAPLHVGLLSPSHTSGAGSGTEHPEGPNFPQAPHPSLYSLCLCLLAIQEYASQVLGNLHAALMPSPTSSLLLSLPSSLRYFHSDFHISLFSFFTFSLHLSVPRFLSAYPPYSFPLWPLAATANPLHEVVSVWSSVQYVWLRPLDMLADLLTA